MNKPVILNSIAECREFRQTVPAATPVFFVPTMGALHEGHASLVRQAAGISAGACVLASIFVNPTQFGPNEDFNRYPRTLDADVNLLCNAGCAAVFIPEAKEIYPPESSGFSTDRFSIDPGPLGNILEGAIRPGHFRGVCTVVAKLINIAQPHKLFLGQKDFQQQLILRQMVVDLNFPVEVVTCATVREADGLAMSSRNRYLNPQERRRAGAIYQALLWAQAQWAADRRDANQLSFGMKALMTDAGLEVQYALAADSHTLAERTGLVAMGDVLLIAAKNGSTRLIDNMLVV